MLLYKNCEDVPPVENDPATIAPVEGFIVNLVEVVYAFIVVVPPDDVAEAKIG